MNSANHQLHTVMYHYVRDLPRTRFPRIKGMLLDEFRAQMAALSSCYEMATLESAMEFLHGDYQPKRDLCLLTFDDGLKEHFAEVTPILAARKIEGLFFVITSALEEHRVASVHMNHFLMAALDFSEYQQAFLQRLRDKAPDAPRIEDLNTERVSQTYRWDEPAVAAFKFLFNFKLDAALRDEIVREIFVERFGDEAEFARELYLNWNEARQMQEAGMLIGGHSHRHQALATMTDDAQADDLNLCRQLMRQNLSAQKWWPFTYPYGKRHTFNQTTARELQRLGFACAFATEVGATAPGNDLFAIRRIDCKDVTAF
ncbi:MAG: polysaccharide deacetylase family protein [Acidobacteriota bacterium]